MSYCPIAIFTYNRPLHLRQLFDSLLQCARLDECEVFIFCDAAKKPEYEADVKTAREVAREFALSINNARLIERKENLGLASPRFW